MPLISIIIRTKNEERWLGHCLAMIYQQDFNDFEVILIDNNSVDGTLEIAKRYPISKLINITSFLPGKALNDGIRLSSGKYIVCMSAHCVPNSTKWLSTLLGNFTNNDRVAGVYGRQLPVSFTDPIDKRDLMIVFGQDKRIQVKDYFFHNANSMLRRDIWDKYPFDENVSNIEDRVWGKQVIEAGYQIVYEPDAAVFHHHGLHQGNALARARGVVSIIEKVDEDFVSHLPDSLKPENANIVAILPVASELRANSLEESKFLNLINALSESKYIKSIFVVSSHKPILANKVNWIERSSIIGVEDIGLDALMKECLNIIEADSSYPDSLLYVNHDYIFRPDNLFDQMIHEAQYKGLDTIFPAYIDYGHYWFKNENEEFCQTDTSMQSRDKRDPVYRALYGLGCLTSSVVIRRGDLVGGKTGILPLDNIKYSLRISDLNDLVCEDIMLHKNGDAK